jgi:hypothetical protein
MIIYRYFESFIIVNVNMDYNQIIAIAGLLILIIDNYFRLVNVNRRFRGACCFHHQGDRIPSTF